MNKVTNIAVLALAAGLAAPAMAQDSVSSNGLGDALSPWDTGDVCTNYVVDLAPVMTSWGTEFGIAPLMKSTRASNDFLNNLISANGTSAGLDTNALGGGSYDLWTTAGAGIHSLNNTAPGSMTAPASVVQFGAAMTDFGDNEQGVVTGVVQYAPDAPGRLYVHRVHTAVNGASSSENRSQIGGISVDTNGDTIFRADNFGATGPNTLTDYNVFRIDFDARACGQLNIIDNDGGSDAAATDWLVLHDATNYTPANLIPGAITGGDAFAVGGTYATQYYYGTTGSISTTSSHLDTSGGGGSDHRGTVAATGRFALGGSAYTLAVLAKDASGATRGMNIWGVTATGAIVSGTQANLVVPTSGVTDNYDGYVLPYEGANIHYYSQTGFRGGVSQIALGATADGSRGLAAMTIADEISGPAQDEWVNSIVMARFDPANPKGTAEWGVVAYCNDAGGGGKEITDGAGGVVGQLVPLIDLGASALGPSMSPPAIDSAGNVWFISSVELYKTDMSGNPIVDTDSALIRAVYDDASYSWELELVLELGDVFTGQNSDTRWQIQFMGVSDSDSVSSGTLFSNGIIQDAFAGANPADFDTADPRTLGGIVVNADITYDTNDDGMYDEDTGDESYQALLFVGNTTPLEDETCPADQNGDNAFNNTDINLFVNNFLTMNPAADINNDGAYNNTDINLFVNLFLTQCM